MPEAVCKVNVDTGRCSQKGTVEPGSCMKDPTTKRCRRKTERRQLRFQPAHTQKLKPCPSGKVRNPQSNRCILKTNPIAQKMRMTNETMVIGGPISISYYEVEVKVNSTMVTKRFLFFGDRHTPYTENKHPSVITITTLIKKIIRKSPHCIDLFVERQVDQRLDPTRARGKFLSGYTCPLDAVRQEFQGCPLHDKPGAVCPYDNLRYHNWDLRFAHRKVNPYDSLLMYVRVHERFLKTFTKTYTLQHAIKYLLGLPVSERAKTRWDLFFKGEIEDYSSRVIQFPEAATGTDFQEYRKEVIQRTYGKVTKDVAFPKDLVNTFTKLFTADKMRSPGEFTHIFTDFYLICRMFQKFGSQDAKSRRTPKRCPVKSVRGKTSYATPQYIIVYAGDDHIKYMERFLQSMFTGPIRKYHMVNTRLNKRISLSDITFTPGFRKPESLEGLFHPFYE
jgi:hypothetical protein